MSGINMGKVIVGSLVAGLVMNAIDFAVNVPWLGRQWEAATVARIYTEAPSAYSARV